MMLSCFLVMQESSLSTQFWILLSKIVLRKLVHDCRYELPDRHPFLEGLVFFFSSSPTPPCTLCFAFKHYYISHWTKLVGHHCFLLWKSWFKFKFSKNWNTDQCIINGSFSVCSPKMFFSRYVIFILFLFSVFSFDFHSGYWPTIDVRETDDPSSGSLDLRFHQNPIPCPFPQTSPSPLFVVAQNRNMQIKYACPLEGPQGIECC